MLHDIYDEDRRRRAEQVRRQLDRGEYVTPERIAATAEAMMNDEEIAEMLHLDQEGWDR